MKLQFTVTACWSSVHEHTGIIGSIPELGEWDAPAKSFELQLVLQPTTQSEPATWMGTLEISQERWNELSELGKTVEYKVIHWIDSSIPVPGLPKFKPCVWGPTAFGKSPPGYIVEPTSVSSRRDITDEMIQSLEWEEGNSDLSIDGIGNRELRFTRKSDDEGNNSSVKNKAQNMFLTHYIDVDENLLADGVTYGLPAIRSRRAATRICSNNNVVLSKNSNLMTLEAQRTTCYYESLRESKSMHYNRIWDRIVTGTCPRSEEHMKRLRDVEKISDILNFQTAEDIRHNIPCNVEERLGGVDRESRKADSQIVCTLFHTYQQLGIRFTWLPTFDMDSSARALTLASSVFVLAGLLMNPNCSGIYVHCSAGVGRSISCVAGLLHCCLQMPLRDVNLAIVSRRSVAFFDQNALQAGAVDFNSKFHGALQLLIQQHAQQLRAPPIADAYVAATRRPESSRRGSESSRASSDEPVNHSNSKTFAVRSVDAQQRS